MIKYAMPFLASLMLFATDAHLLTKNVLKFSLQSPQCDIQRFPRGNDAGLKGQLYNFNVLSPKMGNEVRIVVSGDSTTIGCCALTTEQRDAVAPEQRLTDQADGSAYGQRGWPYLLKGLLRDNNNTIDYTFLNYAVAGGTVSNYNMTDINPQTNWLNIYQDCRYEMLQKSLPNFVFYSFGAFDTHLINYSEKEFKRGYIQLIKETQNLPSKPMIFLMTPVFSCDNKLIPDGLEHYLQPRAKCSPESKPNWYQVILEVAQATGILKEHIVDAGAIIRPKGGQDLVVSDGVHPNLKGMGEIAQEAFMKMSLSPAYHAQQDMIIKGLDQNFNLAVKSEYKKQGLIQCESNATTVANTTRNSIKLASK